MRVGINVLLYKIALIDLLIIRIKNFALITYLNFEFLSFTHFMTLNDNKMFTET